MHYINIHEMERGAKEILDTPIFDFFAGGAADERTAHNNVSDFQSIQFNPKVLTGTTNTNLSASILGSKFKYPIISAPMAFQRLAHNDGEFSVARALHNRGLGFTCSTMSSVSLEDIAASSTGVNWFQLYVFKDRNLTLALLGRAQEAGYSGIMLTVDVPVMGKRERDYRNQFSLPDDVVAANLSSGMSLKGRQKPGHSSVKTFTDDQIDASLTWCDVAWLKSRTSLPLIVKGISRDSDAERAIDAGVDAIIVSNHGGRQLDGVVSSIKMLPTVARKVRGRIPVIFDGGIRRGTDIVKALALGADAVLIGRPLLWGLALAGEEGVEKTLSILCDELEDTMILCGCESIAQLQEDSGLIVKCELVKNY